MKGTSRWFGLFGAALIVVSVCLVVLDATNPEPEYHTSAWGGAAGSRSNSRAALGGDTRIGNRRELSSENAGDRSFKNDSAHWRIRAVDDSGRGVTGFVAHVLSAEHVRDPSVRQILAKLEGRSREAHERIGKRYEADTDGIAHIPWDGSTCSVAIARDELYGELFIETPPGPGDELVAALRRVRSMIIRVVDAEGRPSSSGTRVDLIWEHEGSPMRTPIGETNPRGELLVDDSIRIIQHARTTAHRSVGFAAGIPGSPEALRIELTSGWPPERVLTLPELGVLDVVLVHESIRPEEFQASLSILADGQSSGLSIAYPLPSGSRLGIPVAVTRAYVLEIRGSERVLFRTRVVGPARAGQRVRVEWTPSGYATIRARLIDQQTRAPFGTRSATVRFEAPGNPLYPRYERTRCEDGGVLTHVGDVEDLRDVRMVSVRFDDGTVFASVPFAARDGTVDLGDLVSLSTTKLADVLIVDAAEETIPDARLSVHHVDGADASVIRQGERFSLLTTGTIAEVGVTVDAPGFVSKSVRVGLGPKEQVVTLERAGSLTARVLVDGEIGAKLLGVTLTKKARQSGSQWGRRISGEGGALLWEWRDIAAGTYDVWVLGMTPPLPLQHEEVSVLEGASEVEFDLRGKLGIARIAIDNPTAPILVLNGERGSSTYLCGSYLAASGGDLLLPGATRVLLARRRSRILESTVSPGQSPAIELSPPTVLPISIEPGLADEVILSLVPVAGSLGPETRCHLWVMGGRRPTTLGQLVGTKSEMDVRHAAWSFDGSYRVQIRGADGAGVVPRVEPSIAHVRDGTVTPGMRIFRE